MNVDDRIVDRGAAILRYDLETLLVTNGGGRVAQRICGRCFPDLHATANVGSNTQTRTYGRMPRSAGKAVLRSWPSTASPTPRCASVRRRSLCSMRPNCPTGVMDLILAPDQMVLQIHESIGHPLELDRILGDERNYAGTSFVTPDMFGTYQYGSELLNVTFDPTVAGEVASYGYDDDGTPGRAHLPHQGRHPAAPDGRHDLAGPRRAWTVWPTAGRRAGTVRRSTGWRTSTWRPATRPSTN